MSNYTGVYKGFMVWVPRWFGLYFPEKASIVETWTDDSDTNDGNDIGQHCYALFKNEADAHAALAELKKNVDPNEILWVVETPTYMGRGTDELPSVYPQTREQLYKRLFADNHNLFEVFYTEEKARAAVA